uniref:Glutathione S-transferase GSTe8 n=1 Tax=Dendroctonus armandi TaxID=77159 RepID=A0A5P9JSK0_9CUCU|nr:glutathione S-transferase GSTe8 [Dendroctonus armandi]
MGKKLYITWGSPPVNAVLMAAKALSIDLDLHELDLSQQENLSEWYLKINPTGTVPALDDEGFIVWDSHAILMYLQKKYGNGTDIQPKDPQKQTRILQFLNFDCGMLFRRMSDCLRPIFYEGHTNFDPKALDRAKSSYAILDRILKEDNFVAGDNLTIADISIFATMIAQNAFLPIEEHEFPSLRKWYSQLKSFDFYDAALKGEVTLKDGLKTKLKHY